MTTNKPILKNLLAPIKLLCANHKPYSIPKSPLSSQAKRGVCPLPQYISHEKTSSTELTYMLIFKRNHSRYPVLKVEEEATSSQLARAKMWEHLVYLKK